MKTIVFIEVCDVSQTKKRKSVSPTTIIIFTEGSDFMDIAERIRALREDNDKSQSEIAEILNVGQRTYSDYETRKIRIPLESVIILAKYYNVDMNYICGITKEKEPFPKD